MTVHGKADLLNNLALEILFWNTYTWYFIIWFNFRNINQYSITFNRNQLLRNRCQIVNQVYNMRNQQCTPPEKSRLVCLPSLDSQTTWQIQNRPQSPAASYHETTMTHWCRWHHYSVARYLRTLPQGPRSTCSSPFSPPRPTGGFDAYRVEPQRRAAHVLLS